MKFDHVQSAKQIEFYFSLGNSATAAARAFNTWRQANNVDCPIVKEYEVRRAVKKFRRTGNVNRDNKGNSGRPNTAVNEEKAFDVFTYMTDPEITGTKSVRVCRCNKSFSFIRPSIM